MALVAGLDDGPTTLGQIPRAGRQLRRDGCVGRHPVGEGILAVLDDGLAGLVSVVRGPGLAGRDGRVVDELEEVLAIASNNGNLLAVLPQSVKLVGVSSLDLLAGDVGQLGFGHQRLGLGADEFLFEDDNLGGVGLFILEMGNLVGDLLLA